MNENTDKRTYRVVEILANEFTSEEKRVTEKVIWQGQDVDELSQLYPPSDVFEADSLKHHEVEEGYLIWDYRFECQTDGNWEVCKDPRNRRFVSDEFLEMERETDRYNRRKFPGDYVRDDEDWRDSDPDYPYDNYYDEE